MLGRLGSPRRGVSRRRVTGPSDHVIRLDPRNAVAYQDTGSAYYQLGQYERAIWDFNEAIMRDSEYAEAYYNRGISYESIGKQMEAERDYAKAKELGYEGADADVNRGDA